MKIYISISVSIFVIYYAMKLESMLYDIIRPLWNTVCHKKAKVYFFILGYNYKRK